MPSINILLITHPVASPRPAPLPRAHSDILLNSPASQAAHRHSGRLAPAAEDSLTASASGVRNAPSGKSRSTGGGNHPVISGIVLSRVIVLSCYGPASHTLRFPWGRFPPKNAPCQFGQFVIQDRKIPVQSPGGCQISLNQVISSIPAAINHSICTFTINPCRSFASLHLSRRSFGRNRRHLLSKSRKIPMWSALPG